MITGLLDRRTTQRAKDELFVPHLLVDVGVERVNFDSSTLPLPDGHNILVKALHKLRPGVCECCLEAGLLHISTLS